jgi:hypothetical protein
MPLPFVGLAGALAATPIWIFGSVFVSCLQLSVVVYNALRIGLDLVFFWVAGVLRAFVSWLGSPWWFDSQWKQRSKLDRALSQSRTFEEWVANAVRIDRLESADNWRRQHDSVHYDYELVSSMLSQLREARKSGNVHELMFLLGSALHRRFGSIDRSILCECWH